MESWQTAIAQHGYAILAAAVFLEAIGLPIPAALALLIAGGAAAHGMLQPADSFYRRGRTLLVIAKFIPGINTMAPPLAGSMNMRLAMFLRLDLAGALLYIGSYLGAGYVFSGALDAITRGYHAVGQILTWVVIALLAGYLAFRLSL